MKSIVDYIVENASIEAILNNHIQENTPINESYLRIDSEEYGNLVESVRMLAEANKYKPNNAEIVILEKLESGKKAIFKGDDRNKEVKLHIPMPNPSRNEDGKRFLVYIKSDKIDEETGLPIAKALKFASWSKDLDINNDDEGAVNSFWARHQCSTKKDVNTAGYWACYAPELFGKMLKLRGGNERW